MSPDFLSVFQAFLFVLLGQSPIYLVWIIGIVIASMQWRQHPRLSLLVLIAFVCFLILSAINALLQVYLPFSMQRNNLSVTQIGFVFSVIGWINSLISAALWGLILWAIFGKALRSLATPPSGADTGK